MVVIRLALLLQGLLLAARCEVRARDPEEEAEDLKDTPDGEAWDYGLPLGGVGTSHSDGLNRQSPNVYGAIQHPPDHRHHGHHDPSHGDPHPDVPDGASEPSTEHENKGPQLRTGNWCAFVNKRVITVAVACGTEKYTIKSQSPCPSGTPDCQLIMYKLSTRPVYREKQKIYTALQWRCCPGHAGNNCDDTVADGHISDSEDSTMAGGPHSGSHQAPIYGHDKLTHRFENQNREQNDFQEFGSSVYEAEQPDAENQTAVEAREQHRPHAGHKHHHNQDSERRDPHAVNEGIQTPYSIYGLLPILKETVMSQLQPVLDNFNLTLERLFQEVQGLQRDMAHLRQSQGHGRVVEPLEVDKEEHENQEAFEAELNESLQKLEEVQTQFRNHRSEIEERLHAHQSMLLYNLTNFKTDVDLKIKRHQKTLQANLHYLNSSMSEVRQEQERLDEDIQRVGTEKFVPTQNQPPHDNTGVWEAIDRLDLKVINNSVGLSALFEGQEQINKNIKDIQSGWTDLEDKIELTGRNSQIQFMETGLEVDAAKEKVLNRITELGRNISAFQEALQEIESDVDYIYTEHYKNASTTGRDCDCTALVSSMTQLKQDVANVMELANENREALNTEVELDNQESGAWIPSVEDLKQVLLNVQRSLAFEQEKSRMLQQNVTRLQSSLSGSQQDITTLHERDRAKVEKIQHLNSTFNSLLQDAIRHSEVLEILLGEEVSVFREWSSEDQKGYSVPALRESINKMHKLINSHSLHSATPRETAADEPSVLEDWAAMEMKRRRGDQRFDQYEEPVEYADSDFSTLEKTVEQLGAHIQRLEEHSSCCNCTAAAVGGVERVKLEAEVATLRKNIEDHLAAFNSIFSNTEGLADSEGSLDLEKLSALIRRKAEKQQKKKQKKRTSKRGVRSEERVNHRSRRDASLETAVLRQPPDSPFMFLASSTDGASGSGTVLFDSVALNHGQTYTPKTGTFRAPTSGVYLFVVTLDFGPGPSLAQLKRGGDVAASLRQSQRKLGGPATRVCILQLQQGEELHLELVQGTLERSNPQDNTFAGLLVLQTT